MIVLLAFVTRTNSLGSVRQINPRIARAGAIAKWQVHPANDAVAGEEFERPTDRRPADAEPPVGDRRHEEERPGRQMAQVDIAPQLVAK